MEDPINSPKEQRESSENGDVGRDGRDFLCFSSASEDELASLEGRGVSGNSTSRRSEIYWLNCHDSLYLY